MHSFVYRARAPPFRFEKSNIEHFKSNGGYFLKNTFLIRDYKTDGTPCLVEVSGDEWKKIIIQNTLLPIEERRYFIADCIEESDYIDRMYMEVSFEEFKTWNKENTRKRDQREFKKKYLFVSFSELQSNGSNKECDIIGENGRFEEDVLDVLLIAELEAKLAKWKPWAVDLLHAYLSGEKRTCTSQIALKYGVSTRTVSRYKLQFEDQVKKFLENS